LAEGSPEETKSELNDASNNWADGKGSELGYLKYFTNLLIKVIGDNKNKTIEEYE